MAKGVSSSNPLPERQHLIMQACRRSKDKTRDDGGRSRSGIHFIAIFALATMLSGCGTQLFDTSQLVQGPKPVVDRDAFEKVDLITELTGKAEFETDVDDNKRLALAYNEFYKQIKDDSDSGVQLRNRIQGRLLQASDQSCGVYFNFLRQFETEGEFGLGTLATALAGAGAIVTRVNTARLLSGLAAISEGTRAEFRQAFFSNLATHVIIPGIENRRRIILEGENSASSSNNAGYSTIGILKKWNLKLTEYPVENAIKDAIFYHAHCNLMTGLIESSDLIQLGKRPGIKAINMAFADMQETQRLIKSLAKDPEGLEDTKGKVSALLADVQKIRVEVEKAKGKIAESRAKALKPFEGVDNPAADETAALDAAISTADAAITKAVEMALDSAPKIAVEVDRIEPGDGGTLTPDQLQQIGDYRARVRVLKADLLGALAKFNQTVETDIKNKLTALESATAAVVTAVNTSVSTAASDADAAFDTAKSTANQIATLVDQVQDDAVAIRDRMAARREAANNFDALEKAKGAIDVAVLKIEDEATKLADSAIDEALSKIRDQSKTAADNLTNSAAGIENADSVLEAYRKASVEASSTYIETLDLEQAAQQTIAVKLATSVLKENTPTNAAEALEKLNAAIMQGLSLEQAIDLEDAVQAAKTGS